MKNMIRYILWCLLVLPVGACRDEGTNPVPDFVRSSIPVFTQKEADTGFIDLLDFDASHVSFDVGWLGTEEVVSVDVWVQFNNSQTGRSDDIQYATVTSFPSEQFDFSFNELIDLFPDEVVTRDTISLGDSFVVGGNTRLADGRYLSGGYSPSVVENHPVLLTYSIACRSDLAGTYDLTLVSGDNGEADVVPNQRIEQISPGYYEISEITMDIFGDAIGGVKYRFRELCGSLTADAESVDFGDQIAIRFNPGSVVDSETGVITFAIEYIEPSCCGLTGIKTVFKATPKGD